MKHLKKERVVILVSPADHARGAECLILEDAEYGTTLFKVYELLSLFVSFLFIFYFMLIHFPLSESCFVVILSFKCCAHEKDYTSHHAVRAVDVTCVRRSGRECC